QPQDGQLTGNEVRSVADELATVSMSDPRHVPTLKNLAILFGILGDAERAQLANRLAEEAGSASLVSAHDAAPLSGQTLSPEP
ncbi:MAG: hypothetical protein Q8K43_02300, partial [Sulfurimicrobium sp.]|nr:hypothetical protein [Sulfurimicrobium sp.]